LRVTTLSWQHISKKNEPEMFTANKTYRKYRTGNYFFPDLKKNKNEIGKYQSGDSVEQDIHQTAILMKQANIVAIRPRKRHYCPDAGTRYKKAENLLNRESLSDLPLI
jgi:hypothetical protein